MLKGMLTEPTQHTFTFLILQESHALRNLLVFAGPESWETSVWMGVG